MSDENEHTSEETEGEMNAGNHIKEQSKTDPSMLNNVTGQPMLEDEEMPSYISVSSPFRREDADANETKQQERIPMEEDHSRSPYPSEDQGGGSIYVLSSGEESNHPYNDEEEEDDYADSEDIDDMDLENEQDNLMLEDEDEEDEDEDEDENPLRLPNDDEEDADTEYEQECYDRASDDFILNNRLKQHHKERSLSLQDLSVSKKNAHAPYNKKRHSTNVFGHNYMGFQESAALYPVAQKKQSMLFKYQHVESKVKRYIREIKEQNRKSMERRIREQEYATNENENPEENENNDDDQLKPMVTNKAIKDYAEKVIKDLQQEETNENGNSVYSEAQIIENGESNKIGIEVTENQYKHIQRDTEMNAYNDIQNEKRAQDCDDRLEKRNGSVDIIAHHIEYQNTLDRNSKFNNMDQSSLVNGHQQAPTLFNLRTLSYEEYMHGDTNTEQKEESSEQKQKSQEKIDEPVTCNEAEMMNAHEMENSNASCPLKIESVKSIRITPEESENVNFARISAADKAKAEKTEVTQLKAQLNQKNVQFQNLQNAYQKKVAENMKMKEELDALKQCLAKYESESKTREMKVASVQTETVTEPVPNKESTTSTGERTNNKISSSSIASTTSSIDQWADNSGCSPAISIKPPDLTQILNSDDSIVLMDGTPRKIAHPLSRAFITSSRILQTLSSITQSKTKAESPLAKNTKKQINENSTDQILNLEYISPIQASSSKKRKATDMLGTSAFAQPFKIPHTTVEFGKKNLVGDIVDVEFKFPGEHTNLKPEQHNTSVNKSVDGSTSVETKTDVGNEHEDSVKCFVYRDEENSKNKSFLIQAEESAKDRLGNEKSCVQECGPYLLGNLEVRMSELNGTISVWGKEISQESNSENEDDMEVLLKSTDKSTCHCWQKTPQPRFNGSTPVCSTNKKLKVPLRFNRSNVSQSSHSLSLNTMKSPFLPDDASAKRYMGSPYSPNTCVPSYDNCDSTKHRKEWSTCKGISNSQEKLHSCCIRHAELVDKECNCGSCHEKQKYEDSPNHSKDKFHSKGIRRSSCKNTLTPDMNNHLHNITSAAANISEAICKYNTQYRRSLPNIPNNSSHSTKCCNTIRDVSCTCKSSVDNIHNHVYSDKQACNHSLSNDGEEDPLLPHKRSHETPEIRQRRLSGKRVRGILMDLLRGCGDCRNSSGSVSKSDLHQKGRSYTANCPPQIKISPCPTPEPACSSSTQCNDRCCHAYARRIESQLEQFQMEMERVRSRSDAILDMLNTLHSVDMN